MSDDFEKAVLINFNYGGNINPQLKVVHPTEPLHQQEQQQQCGSSRCCQGRHSPSLLLACLQEQAAAYIASIKQSSDCWKLCCERFPATLYPEVKFWCLQSLHEVMPGPSSSSSSQTVLLVTGSSRIRQQMAFMDGLQ